MDTRTTTTLNTVEIESVKKIIEEAIFAPFTPLLIPKDAPWYLKGERWLQSKSPMILKIMLGSALLTIILAVPVYYLKLKLFGLLAASTGIFSVTFSLAVVFTSTVVQAPLIFNALRYPDKNAMQMVDRAIERYKDLAEKLVVCEPKAIRYVAMTMKAEKEGFERRGSMLSGAIDKIGIFPAIAGIVVLAAALDKMPYANQWVWLLIPTLVAFHLMNAIMFPTGQKMERITAVMEFALDIAEEKEGN